MRSETITLDNFNAVPSSTLEEGMRIRQSGIAKVQWQKLDIEVPESCVIPNGLDIYKD